jgi:hypothetical protein
MAFCEPLVLFRRWKCRALRSPCKMVWIGHLNVEISPTGTILQSVFVINKERLHFARFGACVKARTWHALRWAYKMEWKQRVSVEISPRWSELQSIRYENILMIFCCEFVGLFPRWQWCALRSPCKMEWRERLNFDISPTGTKLLLVFVKMEERLRFASC